MTISSDATMVVVVSLLVCIGLVATRRWHGHLSTDSLVGVQKFHVEPTPRVGGVAIFCGIFAAWVWGAESLREMLFILVVAGLPAFVFGLVEDVTKKVGVAVRLAATFLSGVAACLIGDMALDRVDIPYVDLWLEVWPVSVLFTSFAVAGIANSINIIDGFNGLASGVVMVMLVALSLLAFRFGDTEVGTLCILLIAAVLGFFCLNFPLGKIFLGDGGAYFVGFAFAWLVVVLLMRNPEISPWSGLLLAGYPVVEVLYSVGRRIRNGQSSGSPDALHLHSLIKTRLLRPRTKDWRPHLRNSAVAPFAWVIAAIPAFAAVMMQGQPVLFFALAFAGYIVFYHVTYQILLRRPDLEPPASDSILNK